MAMDTLYSTTASSGDIRKNILLAAGAIMAIMVLFPPKVMTATLFGESETKSAGYVFLFSDPAATPFGPNPIVTSGIEWWKLLLQLAFVGVAAYFAIRYVQGQRRAA
jgi:hypothetical protein